MAIGKSAQLWQQLAFIASISTARHIHFGESEHDILCSVAYLKPFTSRIWAGARRHFAPKRKFGATTMLPKTFLSMRGRR